MRLSLPVLIAILVLSTDAIPLPADEPATETGFVQIFDGKTMTNWKVAEENQDAWKIEDGALKSDGERCHLFYVGPLAPMKDFHFKAEVMTTPGSNAGIYFHTKYQPTDWPKFGYECQVNVSHKDPKKTSSLYSVENVSESDLAANGIQDNQWYTQEIIVTGRRIQLIVDGKTMVDYTEPESKEAFDKKFERRLGEGTIALQAHDPKSVCYFRNLRVKPL
jgi:hypothetical protein